MNIRFITKIAETEFNPHKQRTENIMECKTTMSTTVTKLGQKEFRVVEQIIWDYLDYKIPTSTTQNLPKVIKFLNKFNDLEETVHKTGINIGAN